MAVDTKLHKKLVSLDPDVYKLISDEQARSGYADYLQACRKSLFSSDNPKSFDEWLQTEI